MGHEATCFLKTLSYRLSNRPASVIRATKPLPNCGSRVKWRGVGFDDGAGLPPHLQYQTYTLIIINFIFFTNVLQFMISSYLLLYIVHVYYYIII